MNNKMEILSKGTFGQPAVVRIGKQEYVAFNHDPNTILILEDVARGLLLKDIPSGIAFTPCKRVQLVDDLNAGLDLDWDPQILPQHFEGIAPFRISSLGGNRAGIVVSWYCTKGFWNNEAGYRWKLTRARTAVLARKKGLEGIRFHQFVDHGYLAGVEFTTSIKACGAETVIKTAYEISDQIQSIIEDAIKPKAKGNPSETEFVRNTFIPLLKKLGFQDVIFHHGPREFGRDVLFSRQTEFGVPEYWAAQVKLGNVGGRANSFVDLIVNQAQEAFKIPLYDVRTKSKVWISKFLVAITGKFTENAVEKICEKIDNHSQRNNIIFLDGDKLQELLQKKKIAGSKSSLNQR